MFSDHVHVETKLSLVLAFVLQLALLAFMFS